MGLWSTVTSRCGPFINAITEFAADVPASPLKPQREKAKVAELATPPNAGEAYRITGEGPCVTKPSPSKARVVEQVIASGVEEDAKKTAKSSTAWKSRIVRGRVVRGEPRIDGRDPEMIRALSTPPA